MKKWKEQLFYRAAPVELTCSDGTKAMGRGIIVKLKESTGSAFSGVYHDLGLLGKPLYIFTGDLSAADPGDTLKSGGAQYTVLHSALLEVNGEPLALRAVLEKGGETDDSL